MKTVTVREAQHHLSKVLDYVEDGEEVVITRRGRSIAKLILCPDDLDSHSTVVPDFRAIRLKIGTEGAGGRNAILQERDEEG